MNNSYYTNKKINIKLIKDLRKRHWLVNVERCHFDKYKNYKDNSNAVPKPDSKKKPSLKVSLPKRHYLKAMEQYRNLGIKTQIPNKPHGRRQPPGLLQKTNLSQQSEMPQQSEQPQQVKLPKRPGLRKQMEPPQKSELPQQQAWRQSMAAQQSRPYQQQGGPQLEPSQKASPSQQLLTSKQQAPQQTVLSQQPGFPQKLQPSEQKLTPQSGLPKQTLLPQQLRTPLQHVGQPSTASQRSGPPQLLKMPQISTGQQTESPQQLVMSQQLRPSQLQPRLHTTLSQLSGPSQQLSSPREQVGKQSEQLQQSARSQLSGPPLQLRLPTHQFGQQLKLPQQSQKDLSTMTPTLISPGSLRMFRHSVPTNKGRIITADKTDQTDKPTEHIPPKSDLKSDPTVPHRTAPPTKEDVKMTTEETKQTNTFNDIVNHETPISIKHKLPLAVVASKGSYRSSNPVNKENQQTACNAETKIVRATQTEEAFIVTKEYYDFLQKMHTSGFSPEELEYQLDNMIEQRENINKNDNDTTVIDLENTEENNHTNNDILDEVLKHSTNNKQALLVNATVQAMQYFSGQAPQPLVPPVAFPAEPSPASTSETHLPESIPPTAATGHTQPNSPSMIPCSDILKTFMVMATLQKLGFNLPNNMPDPQQSPVKRKETNDVYTQTNAEDENNNSKRRKLYEANEVASETPVHPEGNYQRPAVVQIPQEKPATVAQQQAFQARKSRPLPQKQTQQFVPEHVQQPAQFYPTNFGGIMPQHRAPFPATRAPYQFPYEHNRDAAMGNPLIEQMPAQVQRHPNQRAMHNQLGNPRLARVLSTHEANLHIQAQQQPHYNWSYPQYYDRHGYQQRHQ